MWSRDLLLKFWDPIHISRSVEGRNFKCGRQIGHGGPDEKIQNEGSRDLFLEFWYPSISRERLKLETSNLACRLDTGES